MRRSVFCLSEVNREKSRSSCLLQENSPPFPSFSYANRNNRRPPAMLSAFSKHQEEEANPDRYQIPVLRTCPKMALIKIVIFDRNYTGRGISAGLLKFFS